MTSLAEQETVSFVLIELCKRTEITQPKNGMDPYHLGRTFHFMSSITIIFFYRIDHTMDPSDIMLLDGVR